MRRKLKIKRKENEKNNRLQRLTEDIIKANTDKKKKSKKKKKKEFVCDFPGCNKVFTESGNLKTHYRIHTGERPFTCEYPGCNKSFITKGHLKSHELIHSGEKPFQCEICGKKYSRSGRLKIHIRTHTGERPFKCSFEGCNKTFTEKGNLKTHMRIHTGEKPYQCHFPGCTKCFTTQGHLTDHVRRHTGERPFQCKICDAKFMRSSTLKIHMRRHTGEKPYKCTFPNCHKAFSESGNLKIHIKTHSKDSCRASNKNFEGTLSFKRSSPSNHSVIQQEIKEERKDNPVQPPTKLPNFNLISNSSSNTNVISNNLWRIHSADNTPTPLQRTMDFSYKQSGFFELNNFHEHTPNNGMIKGERDGPFIPLSLMQHSHIGESTPTPSQFASKLFPQIGFVQYDQSKGMYDKFCIPFGGASPLGSLGLSNNYRRRQESISPSPLNMPGSTPQHLQTSWLNLPTTPGSTTDAFKRILCSPTFSNRNSSFQPPSTQVLNYNNGANSITPISGYLKKEANNSNKSQNYPPPPLSFSHQLEGLERHYSQAEETSTNNQKQGEDNLDSVPTPTMNNLQESEAVPSER